MYDYEASYGAEGGGIKVEGAVEVFPSREEGRKTVEGRHVTVKLLLLIYGSLDGRALNAGKPISSSACCQAFYS